MPRAGWELVWGVSGVDVCTGRGRQEQAGGWVTVSIQGVQSPAAAGCALLTTLRCLWWPAGWELATRGQLLLQLSLRTHACAGAARGKQDPTAPLPGNNRYLNSRLLNSRVDRAAVARGMRPVISGSPPRYNCRTPPSDRISAQAGRQAGRRAQGVSSHQEAAKRGLGKCLSWVRLQGDAVCCDCGVSCAAAAAEQSGGHIHAPRTAGSMRIG